jgi:ssDNA-binding replication factor A large subunit
VQQEFRYDLRITGVVDDGITAKNVIIQREAVEKATGLTLEKAIEIAEISPLGPDDVFMQFHERLMGRYISCTGPDIDGTILVSDADSLNLITYDQGEHAMLINRAEGPKGGDLS